MAHNDVALQLSRLLWVDHAVAESPKAGGDAIDHASFGHETLDGLPGAIYALLRLRAESEQEFVGLGIGNGDHIFDGQALAVQNKCPR
jgi:hypothetical protein